jgi:hypothetical protein
MRKPDRYADWVLFRNQQEANGPSSAGDEELLAAAREE